MDDVVKWCKEHKLRTIGGIWLSGIGASMAYNYTKTNLRTSVKVRGMNNSSLLTTNKSIHDTTRNERAAGARPQFFSLFLYHTFLPCLLFFSFHIFHIIHLNRTCMCVCAMRGEISIPLGDSLSHLCAGVDARMSLGLGRGGDV